VSSDDGLLKLWDLTSQRVAFTTNSLRGIHAFVSLDFSPGARFLAAPAPESTPSKVSLNLWEILPSPRGGTPTVILKTNLGFLGPAAFSPDERTMAVGNQSEYNITVGLYDFSDGTTKNFGPSHSEGITCIAFSPDGSRLATGSSDERVVLWDVKRGSASRVFRGDLISVNSVAFAPDGQTLFAGCSNQNIHAWNLEVPTRPNVLAGHSAAVNALAISPCGRWLASASQDGTARVWSLQGTVTPSDARSALEFTTLLRSEDIHSSGIGPPGVWGLAVSPNELQVAVAVTDQLILYDLQTDRVLASVAATNVFAAATNEFRSVAFSPDGRRLVAGTADGAAAFLDAISLRPLTSSTKLHTDQITDIAYALGGTVLATAGGFGKGITLTDVASGRLLTNLSAVEEGFYPLQPLAVSPDGKRLATGSPDRETSGRQPMRWLSGHSGGVTVLAFSPDGTLASGGMDHTIRLWHPELDQETAILTGHSGWILCLAFAEHGNTLVSGSLDGTLRVWRALSLEQIAAQDRAGVVRGLK